MVGALGLAVMLSGFSPHDGDRSEEIQASFTFWMGAFSCFQRKLQCAPASPVWATPKYWCRASFEGRSFVKDKYTSSGLPAGTAKEEYSGVSSLVVASRIAESACDHVSPPS